MNLAVKLENLVVGYHRQAVLGPLNMELRMGEFLTLIGPNGSGKTALVKTLLSLIPELSGEIKIFGSRPEQSLRIFPGKIGYVPQHGLLNSQIPLTGEELLALNSGSTPEVVQELQKILNLSSDLLSKPLNDMSGGERQKVLLLFALSGSPKLTILDEATDGLDAPSMQGLFFYLNKKVVAKEMSVILVSHDISAVAKISNRVICVNRSVLFDGDPNSPEFHTCLHSVYGTDSVIHNHHHHNH